MPDTAFLDYEHVAVVDDDEAVRFSTARLLKRKGFVTHVFTGGEMFLGEGLRQRFDCILLDVRMPGIDGLGVLRALKAQAGHVAPVIILTGHGDVPLAVEAMKLGARDFIEKPYTPDTLFQSIRNAIDGLPPPSF
ncbi:response regulator transcription factor [Sphingoaurantiacus capsulatus]|uniref:Response regulator transcription factor n=1 Tax=Sphingoaurantiacus capsulatus TaxID=1771310 RepID=A0ABV7X4N5_9SPHN